MTATAPRHQPADTIEEVTMIRRSPMPSILPQPQGVARHPMNESLTYKKALPLICGLALVISSAVVTTADAVEPEKQRIYYNIENGFLCGTSSSNQCKVPAGQRLIIEYVSGFLFATPSSDQTTVVSMAATDQSLGLNGTSFHTFSATKVNRTPTSDVFTFSTPMKVMLHPNATFYFSDVADVAVSGYLVSFTGP